MNGHYLANNVQVIKVIQLNPSLKISISYFQELSTLTSTGITISFLGKAQTQNH